MKAIILKKFGDVDQFEYRDAPIPDLKSDQVLIKVKAIGVNFGDVLIRQGLHKEAPRPPAIHGSEISGVIEKIGNGLLKNTNFQIGDRVMGFLPEYGGFAEYVVATPELFQKIPDKFDYIEGSAFTVNFMTAHLLTHKLGNVKKNESVLIHSASGGVGTALIQLCKYLGATIYCTASKSKHSKLQELGVKACFEYTDDIKKLLKMSSSESGFDIIFDSLGAGSFRNSYNMLNPFGRLVMFGASSFISGGKFNFFSALKNLLSFPVFFPIRIMNQTKSISGLGLLVLQKTNPHTSGALAEVTKLWADGKIAGPIIDKVFPFEQIREAQKYLESRKNFGKVVLEV